MLGVDDFRLSPLRRPVLRDRNEELRDPGLTEFDHYTGQRPASKVPVVAVSGRSIVEMVKWTSSLAALEKASNLGYLGPYRLSEPSSGNQIMEHPKDSMSKVKLFDVSNSNAVGYVFNLKPCVEASWNTMLESHVDMIRQVPSASGDHRALEAAEEFSIFASQHAVGKIGELRYPHHLRISLGVLGRIQNEIKCLDGTDSSNDRNSFTSHHRFLKIHLPGVGQEGMDAVRRCGPRSIACPHRLPAWKVAFDGSGGRRG